MSPFSYNFLYISYVIVYIENVNKSLNLFGTASGPHEEPVYLIAPYIRDFMLMINDIISLNNDVCISKIYYSYYIYPSTINKYVIRYIYL